MTDLGFVFGVLAPLAIALMGTGIAGFILLLRKLFEPGLYAWFDSRLLTPLQIILLPGSEVEMVLRSSKLTVWKPLLFYTGKLFAYLLMSIVIASSIGTFADIFLGDFALILVTLLTYVVVFLIGFSPALLYFVWEWERLHAVLVVTTAWVFYAKARFRVLGLIFPQASVSSSDGTSAQLRETKLETDIEDIDGVKQTGWFEELIDNLAFKTHGTANVLLASNYFGAGDTLKQFDHADWVKNVLHIIQARSERTLAKFSYFYKTMAEAEMGRFGASTDEVQKTSARLSDFMSKNRKFNLSKVPVIDFWSIVDPQIWVFPRFDPTSGASWSDESFDADVPEISNGPIGGSSAIVVPDL